MELVDTLDLGSSGVSRGDKRHNRRKPFVSALSNLLCKSSYLHFAPLMLQGEWKMATITKRKTKWQVRIRLSNTPTITKTFNRKSNAKKWAREIENKIECGILGAVVKPTDETLGEVLEKYLHQITPQ